MIDSYINIDKNHKSFDKAFKELGLNKLVLKNVTKSSQINLVVTSLSKYGETKKNLSDFESTNKSFPTLIFVDDKDFEQTIDLIQNPLIELISSKNNKQYLGLVKQIPSRSDTDLEINELFVIEYYSR